MLGFAAVLLAIAFTLVSNNTRDVSRYMRHSERRLKAQAAADEFVELVQRRFDQAVWEKADGSDTPEFMEDVYTIHQKFFGSGKSESGMCHSLASTIEEFNLTNANNGVCVMANLPVTVNVTDLRDEGGVSPYAEVSFFVGADGMAVEEKVRFGALGFGEWGRYDENVRVLPTRAVESAINADCPLVFGNCRGTSGWTINGEVRTRGTVRIVEPETSEATTRIHGEIHVREMPQAGWASFPSELRNGFVDGARSLDWYSAVIPSATSPLRSELQARCANGDANMRMRFPSPGRRRDLNVPGSGTPAWYDYPERGFDSVFSNGVWRGGYEWWRVEVDVPEGAAAPAVENDPEGRIFTGERADWFHIPVMSHLKDYLKTGFKGSLTPPKLNKTDLANTLGLYPDGSPVEFFIDNQSKIEVVESTRETLYLLGSWRKPIQLKGPVYWHGDVVIGGFVSGQGAIYAGRNIHIVRDIVMRDPPTWRQDADFNGESRKWNARADMFALLARGSIVIGNYADTTSRNAVDDVTGFREKVRLASSLSEQAELATSRLDGYVYRAPVRLASDSQIGNGTFDGDYFSTYEGTPLLHPRHGADYLGNSVTNLCRPVVRIDAMLVSENAIVGVVGPGDFSWAKVRLEPGPTGDGDDGMDAYPGNLEKSVRAGHGMLLKGLTPEDYLLPEFTAFELNGGLVCRDLAIYVDWEGNDYRWENHKDDVQAVINWDPRYQVDGDDAAGMTRELMRTGSPPFGGPPFMNDHPQNVLGLPTDSSPKPQIISWRFLTDGVK